MISCNLRPMGTSHATPLLAKQAGGYLSSERHALQGHRLKRVVSIKVISSQNKKETRRTSPSVYTNSRASENIYLMRLCVQPIAAFIACDRRRCNQQNSENFPDVVVLQMFRALGRPAFPIPRTTKYLRLYLPG